MTLKEQLTALRTRLDAANGPGSADAALAAMNERGTFKEQIAVLLPLVNAADEEERANAAPPPPPQPAPPPPAIETPLSKARATIAAYEAKPKAERSRHYQAHAAELDAALALVEKADKKPGANPANAARERALAEASANAALADFRAEVKTGNTPTARAAAENLIGKYQTLQGREKTAFLQANDRDLMQAAALLDSDES